MRFDAIIFDIDNVLVDTRASYTDCIIKTVATYLETVLKFRSSRKSLLNRRDVESFKSLGGFNDDWDACYGLLLYFLQLKPKRHTLNDLAKLKKIAEFAANIKEKPLGITKLTRLLRQRNSSLPRNDVPKGTAKSAVIARQQSMQSRSNLHTEEISIKRIADMFQQFYLSDFVWNESLIIPSSFLKQLKKNGSKLGIVTGRSREEANFALRRFQIDRYFEAMVTVDETPAKFKKPHPYGLFKVAALLGKGLNYLYAGDLPDDILAAKAAKKKMKISSCGFLKASTQPEEMKKEFKKLRADFICEGVKELKEIILN